MCSVSMIYDYGKTITTWDQPTVEAFERLVREAMKFDEATKQPDCEDAEKTKWIEPIKEALEGDALVVYKLTQPPCEADVDHNVSPFSLKD